MYIHAVRGVQIQGRVDYVTVYPQKAWISSSVFLPWSHPQREELMEWYRNIRDQQYSLFGECWLIMVHLDRRNQVGDHVLYIDYTCEARDETKEDFQQMEMEIEDLFPDVSRYVNVPIRMENKEGDRMLIHRYFNDLDELEKLKAQYDPKNIFSPYQGIKPSPVSEESVD